MVRQILDALQNVHMDAHASILVEFTQQIEKGNFTDSQAFETLLEVGEGWVFGLVPSFLAVMVIIGMVFAGLVFLTICCAISCSEPGPRAYMSLVEVDDSQSANETGKWDKDHFKTSINDMSKMKQKVLMKLVEMKLGDQARTATAECMREAQAALPDRLEEANINPFEARKNILAKKNDPYGMTKLIQRVLSAFMLQHGPTIAQQGLGGLGLAACGSFLCGGDLQYRLDDSGLHKCEWKCSEGFVPDEFRLLQTRSLDSGEATRNLETLKLLKKDADEFLKAEQEAERTANLEKSRAWDKLGERNGQIAI